MEQWFENPIIRNTISRPIRRRETFLSDMSWTNILIGINVVSFILFFILAAFVGEGRAVSWVALMPSVALVGQKLWTFVTSMFMHAGLMHLSVNMISLWFIGNFVEKLIGKKRFLWLYLVGGLVAGLTFVVIAALTGVDVNVYAVGASGAIFALGGALAILTPKLPVLVFFVIPMPMWAAMGFLLFGLWAMSASLGLPIGNTAHLGGLIVGLAYGVYLKRKYPRKTRMISEHFSR